MLDHEWFTPDTHGLDKKGLSLTRWQLQRLAEEFTPAVVQRAIDGLSEVRPQRMKAGTWVCDYQECVSVCRRILAKGEQKGAAGNEQER